MYPIIKAPDCSGALLFKDASSHRPNSHPAFRLPGCWSLAPFVSVPVDRITSVAGTSIRFITRLATEIGIVLVVPNNGCSITTPTKGTAAPPIASARREAAIGSHRITYREMTK
jgi:hypothetical protein